MGEDTKWLNALLGLTRSEKAGDTKTFADLLRGNEPIPQGIRDLLADLLDPNAPDLYGGKLVYVETNGLKKLLAKVEVVARHAELVKEGASSRNAAVDVETEFRERGKKIGDRDVFRYKADLKKAADRLRGGK